MRSKAERRRETETKWFVILGGMALSLVGWLEGGIFENCSLFSENLGKNGWTCLIKLFWGTIYKNV